MNTQAIQIDANNEVGVITHEGREFANAGYTRTETHLVAYLGKDGKLTRWDGEVIGTYRIVATWRTPRSFVSSTMNQVEARLADGSKWTGRSAGEGMIYQGRLKR